MLKTVEAKSYLVHIGSNEIYSKINEFLLDNNVENRQVVILCDENTIEYCYPVLMQNVPSLENIEVLQIESGEENKTIEVCSHLWMALNEFNFDRKALMINLGGGVIGDMGGFVASTFKRGIEFINIPTTLLSQVDASVGGKLGVDLDGVKNIVGMFNNPKAVFVNTDFLETLDGREVKSGFAEVIKHGLIYDESYFSYLEEVEPSQLDWTDIVNRSIQIKNEVVIEDPKEQGIRKILNFGHTLGHALESHRLNSGNKMLHGEAVIVGIIAAAYLSFKKTSFTELDLNRVVQFLKTYYVFDAIKNDELEPIFSYMTNDKKNENGEIKFVLLNKIGEASFDHTINRDEIMEAINFFNSQV